MSFYVQNSHVEITMLNNCSFASKSIAIQKPMSCFISDAPSGNLLEFCVAHRVFKASVELVSSLVSSDFLNLGNHVFYI